MRVTRDDVTRTHARARGTCSRARSTVVMTRCARETRERREIARRARETRIESRRRMSSFSETNEWATTTTTTTTTNATMPRAWTDDDAPFARDGMQAHERVKALVETLGKR